MRDEHTDGGAEGSDGWITARRAAAILGRSERRVYELMQSGVIPADRVGRRLYTTRRYLAAYERVRTTTDPARLTAPDVAAILGGSTRRAYELMQTGTIPSYRIGRGRYTTQAHVEGFAPTLRSPESDPMGLFYLIQLVPDLAPTRVKFGWTADLKRRLAEHRTTAPTAIVLDAWSCRRSDERALIAHLTTGAIPCQPVSYETFDCADVPALRAAARVALGGAQSS